MLMGFLDNDLYKFTTQQAARELYPNAYASYEFIDRSPSSGKFTGMFLDELRNEIGRMSDLQLTPAEARYLADLPYMSHSYVDWLRHYRYKPEQVVVGFDKQQHLRLIIDGPWYEATLWEVPLMAIISELYCRRYPEVSSVDVAEQLGDKARVMDACGAKYSDFGTRRRRSAKVHRDVVSFLRLGSEGFQGTSNVHLAREDGVTPIGSMPHEWIQAHSSLCSLLHANRYALEAWYSFYGAELATALPDTYGMQPFLNDFSRSLAERFRTLRQDSGNPYFFVDRLCDFYRFTLGFPRNYVRVLFSNALNALTDVPQLQAYCKDRDIDCAFGIGTNLTNDFGPGAPALNMVIKMRSLDGMPVVKLSDDPGKACGQEDALRVARWTFNREPLD